MLNLWFWCQLQGFQVQGIQWSHQNYNQIIYGTLIAQALTLFATKLTGQDNVRITTPGMPLS